MFNIAMKIVIVGVVSFFALLCWVFYWPIPPYEDYWMDSPTTKDPLFNHPEWLVSKRPLSPEDLNRPVIIAVHGFTGSTFEWQEFKSYAEQMSDVLVSTVLLGGHGRDFIAFRKSTRQEWGKPILDEYNALVKQGFTNISFAASSTGGTLVTLYLIDGKFDLQPPTHVFLIDALVVPQNKNLKYTPYVHTWLFKDAIVKKELDPDLDVILYNANWIQGRSYHALSELSKLSDTLKAKLAKGYSIPIPTTVDIFQSQLDATVDPISAELLYKGLYHPESSPAKVTLRFVESNKHVFTQLAVYKRTSEADRTLQRDTFEYMVSEVSKPVSGSL